MTKILSWKNDLISMALMNLPSKAASDAVQTFRNITGYMGDRGTGKPPLDHALKLLHTLADSTEPLLIDEVYCQLIKQTTNNPSDNGTLRGWQLIAIILSAFPPSDELRLHLANYCSVNLSSTKKRVGAYAEYCLHRTFKICELGRRRELPSTVEIQAIARMRPLNIRVHLLNDQYLMMPAESWTTVGDLQRKLSITLGFHNPTCFALYEFGNDEERLLSETYRVMELVSTWNKRAEEQAKKSSKQGVTNSYLVYKVRHFFDVSEDDAAGLEMMYIQAVFDVVDARYPCSEQDAITLAALQVQQEFGDMPPGYTTVSHIHGKLHKYLSAKYLQGSSAEIRESQIISLYGKLQGYSKAEARLSYLDYVRSWKIYGSTYFFAQPQSGSLPREVVIAVNSRGILLIDSQTKEFLDEIPYSGLRSWGHSATSFVIVTGTETSQDKTYFNTEQGEEINSLVRTYAEAVTR